LSGFVAKNTIKDMLTKKLMFNKKEPKGCIFTVSLKEISVFNENRVPKAVANVLEWLILANPMRVIPMNKPSSSGNSKGVFLTTSSPT
jgi:hypothetical protein